MGTSSIHDRFSVKIEHSRITDFPLDRDVDVDVMSCTLLVLPGGDGEFGVVGW